FELLTEEQQHGPLRLADELATDFKAVLHGPATLDLNLSPGCDACGIHGQKLQTGSRLEFFRDVQSQASHGTVHHPAASARGSRGLSDSHENLYRVAGAAVSLALLGCAALRERVVFLAGLPNWLRRSRRGRGRRRRLMK